MLSARARYASVPYMFTERKLCAISILPHSGLDFILIFFSHFFVGIRWDDMLLLCMLCAWWLPLIRYVAVRSLHCFPCGRRMSDYNIILGAFDKRINVALIVRACMWVCFSYSCRSCWGWAGACRLYIRTSSWIHDLWEMKRFMTFKRFRFIQCRLDGCCCPVSSHRSCPHAHLFRVCLCVCASSIRL